MFYKWKNELETDKNEDKKRLKELEAENLRLKKMHAEFQNRYEVVSEAAEILKKGKADRERRIKCEHTRGSKSVICSCMRVCRVVLQKARPTG